MKTGQGVFIKSEINDYGAFDIALHVSSFLAVSVYAYIVGKTEERNKMKSVKGG